jgi:hypothetical protein
LESFVPALGYNKGFPRAVLLGPSDYGGEEIPHLYTEARIQQMEYLFMHVRAGTELGTLFRINLDWIQLIAGIGEPFLASDCPIPYMKNWFTGLRDFLLLVDGKIIIQDSYVPVIEREHDQLIMTAFSTITPRLSANQLRYLNNWRVFFQVQMLSDITNAK